MKMTVVEIAKSVFPFEIHFCQTGFEVFALNLVDFMGGVESGFTESLSTGVAAFRIEKPVFVF
ncbi:MAG: hypothetical protein ACKO0V_19585 [bacterium]